jgi:hypothetical protein
MMGKAMAVIAAALCTGFFASAVQDTGSDVAAGPVEDSGLVVPNIVTMDRFAAPWTPTACQIACKCDPFSRPITTPSDGAKTGVAEPT